MKVDVDAGSPAKTVVPDTPVRGAAAKLVGEDLGAVVVLDGRGHIAGLLTATNVVRASGTGPCRRTRPSRSSCRRTC
ncbi:CBS domain-containing protein [Halomarina litorea]|uniref:CBS domain-containing protein n=1 Tax=Halomarina litorea TaxID=2961595 RepID=UPI0034A0DD15